MSKEAVQLSLPGFEQAHGRWRAEYGRQIGAERAIRNRSQIEIKPLYTPRDWNGESFLETLGFPGQYPFTRGIYPTMHRGRTWTQRQLIGLGTPEDYNKRVRVILDAGATAISLLPCNSGFRGVDCDEVDPVLLGTCGTVINTTDHMDRALDGVPLGDISAAMNDPSPFTLLAFTLAVAKRRGIPWTSITGTSNQSDYISHFIANHMFYRLSLPGARRVLLDHIEFCRRHVPGWNPVSVVGQHMQQAGATPVETMAFTISTALQYAQDCIDRGMDIDVVLRRFTFFFDISISFFEEVAKFRAGRRIWARLARERLGAKEPASWRFKFHAQTSGVDLTEQQPLNNIARVAVQAMAGIMSGLQSLHTDAYDEAITTPTEETARIAVATQNILREEAHLCDVIDPLGGSYYVETLTDQMETGDRGVDRQDRCGRRHVPGRRSRPRPIHDRHVGARLPATGGKRRGEGDRGQLLSERQRTEPEPRNRAARPCSHDGARGTLQGLQGGAKPKRRAPRARRARTGRQQRARKRVRTDRRGRGSRHHPRRDRRLLAQRARLWPSPCHRLSQRSAANPARRMTISSTGSQRAIRRRWHAASP